MKKQAGFTLIEIIVTLMLMTTVFSLVGPLIYQQVDRAEASSEFIEAKLFLHNSARLAFLQGTPIVVELDGKQITRWIDGTPQVFDFNHLFFPTQRVDINANGFVSMTELQVVAGRRELSIQLDTDSQ